MIKKYFSISLISASLAIAGCSSNDDGGDGETDGMETPTTPAAIVVPQEYTPGEGATEDLVGALTTLSNSGGDNTFNTLLGAVGNDAELVAAATDPASVLTVFAPTDAAFAALEAVPDGEALADVLRFHIVAGALDEALVQASVGSSAEALNGGSLPVTLDDDGTTYRVGGAALLATDIQATNGIIHVIDAVLIPAAEPEEPVEPEEPTDPVDPVDPNAPNLGASLNTLSSLGYSEYVSLHNGSGLGTVYDDQPNWIGFIPTNDAIPDGIDPASADAVVKNHIYTDGAEGVTLLDLVGVADLTTNGGATIVVEGTEGALTVNGFTATPIAVEGGASALFEINGVIQ